MIWPIGQPPGPARAVALRSRELWSELAEASGIHLLPCGSLHVAHREDEWSVLTEFAGTAASRGYECEILSASRVLQRAPGVRAEGLIGGLFSPTEACVNPRRVIPALVGYLAQRLGIHTELSTAAIDIDAGRVRFADGRVIPFDTAVVCCGTDAQTLFPELIRSLGLHLCKLQMLRTSPQPDGWRIGPHIAGGLTLRHYRNFEHCPSLPALAARIADETPELNRYGVHVMASQNETGEVIMGDSHEYDGDVEIFDKALIDELILRELRRMIDLPDWTIAARWQGFYAKHAEKPYVVASPIPGVHVFTGLGGAGMTLALGAAADLWDHWTR